MQGWSCHPIVPPCSFAVHFQQALQPPSTVFVKKPPARARNALSVILFFLFSFCLAALEDPGWCCPFYSESNSVCLFPPLRCQINRCHDLQQSGSVNQPSYLRHSDKMWKHRLGSKLEEDFRCLGSQASNSFTYNIPKGTTNPPERTSSTT